MAIGKRVLKEDVFNESGDVGGRFLAAADEDEEFSRKTGGIGEALDGLLLSVEGQGADGNDAKAYAERDEIDDEVEALELAALLEPLGLDHVAYDSTESSPHTRQRENIRACNNYGFGTPSEEIREFGDIRTIALPLQLYARAHQRLNT